MHIVGVLLGDRSERCCRLQAACAPLTSPSPPPPNSPRCREVEATPEELRRAARQAALSGELLQRGHNPLAVISMLEQPRAFRVLDEG